MVDVEFETRDGRTHTIPCITIREKEHTENLRPLVIGHHREVHFRVAFAPHLRCDVYLPKNRLVGE